MTKRRDYLKESLGPSLTKGQPLSLEDLNRLILELLPEIRSRVQIGIGRRNQTLRMLDLLIGSAKLAHGSQGIIEHMDAEIEYLKSRIEELEGDVYRPKDDNE